MSCCDLHRGDALCNTAEAEDNGSKPEENAVEQKINALRIHLDSDRIGRLNHNRLGRDRDPIQRRRHDAKVRN